MLVLRQLALAALNYESASQTLPPGGFTRPAAWPGSTCNFGPSPRCSGTWHGRPASTR
jgi:hypothetical protein